MATYQRLQTELVKDECSLVAIVLVTSCTSVYIIGSKLWEHERVKQKKEKPFINQCIDATKIRNKELGRAIDHKWLKVFI